MERLCNFASHSIYVWEDLLRDIQYFDDLALSAFVLNTDVGWSNDINILFFNNQFISISESVGVTSQKKIWYISDPRIWKSAVIYDGEASIYLSFHWVWALTHILRLRKVINIRERLYLCVLLTAWFLNLVASSLLCLISFIAFFSDWSWFDLLITSVFVNDLVNDFKAYQNNKTLTHSLKILYLFCCFMVGFICRIVIQIVV